MGRLCPNICHRSATWLCKLVSSLTFRPQSKACHRSHTNVITAIHSLWYITCRVGEGLCYLCRRRYYIPRHWQITTFKNMTNSLQKTILSTPKRAPDQSSYTISLPCFLCCSGLFSAVGTINRAVSERWWVFWSRSKGAGWGRTLPTWALQRPHQWSLAFKERVRGGGDALRNGIIRPSYCSSIAAFITRHFDPASHNFGNYVSVFAVDAPPFIRRNSY